MSLYTKELQAVRLVSLKVWRLIQKNEDTQGVITVRYLRVTIHGKNFMFFLIAAPFHHMEIFWMSCTSLYSCFPKIQTDMVFQKMLQFPLELTINDADLNYVNLSMSF